MNTKENEPFHSQQKLPPEVEKVKRELTYGKVMVLAAYSKTKVISAAMNLALEIEKLSKLPVRGLDLLEVAQNWSLNKNHALEEYAGAMGSPVLVLAYYGVDFCKIYNDKGYRQDELRNWMKLHLRRRVKDGKVTVVAGNAKCNSEAMVGLFGDYAVDLKGRFIYVDMGGKPK